MGSARQTRDTRSRTPPRSEAVRAEGQLQELADASPQHARTAALQTLADESPEVALLAGLQDLAHTSARVVQPRLRLAERWRGLDRDAIRGVATTGLRGPSGPLPHLDAIQSSFGKHDVSEVRAHTDRSAAQAARAMGARAYTAGDAVAFAGPSPDLHTSAHEAAHVLQQRAGVQLKSQVGEVGDRYERHADAVADRVVAGRSAADLLDRYATPGSSPAPVQAKAVQRLPVVPEITVDEEKAILDYKSDNYKYFNWYLRGQQLTTSKVRSYGRTKVPQLRSALATMVQYRKYRHTGSLYRGDVFDNYSTSDQAQMSQARGQLTIPSFMSTTKSKSVAKGYGTGFWKISSNRSGVDIHAAGLGQEQEQEVLFPPDCTFQVETTKRDVKTGLFSSKPKLTVRQV